MTSHRSAPINCQDKDINTCSRGCIHQYLSLCSKMTAVQQTLPGSELDALFPFPSLPPNVLSPSRYPGASPEAAAALTHVLKDNHTKYHIFFNHKRFHKCVCIFNMCLVLLIRASMKPYHSSRTSTLCHGREWIPDPPVLQGRWLLPTPSY